MSTTALEIDAPQLCATDLIARPGALPTITVPVAGNRLPDVDAVWSYLRETADFFGLPMPGPDHLRAALEPFVAPARVFAVDLVVVESGGASRILASGQPVRMVNSEPVRLTGVAGWPTSRATDPSWRRMAARTTSKGAADQLDRWLLGQGYVDAVTEHLPILGAVVFEVDGHLVGVENPEPVSILDQMAQSGLIAAVDRGDGWPTAARRAWWISRRYEIHPVAALDGMPFDVESDAAPNFARLP